MNERENEELAVLAIFLKSRDTGHNPLLGTGAHPGTYMRLYVAAAKSVVELSKRLMIQSAKDTGVNRSAAEWIRIISGFQPQFLGKRDDSLSKEFLEIPCSEEQTIKEVTHND